MSDDAADDWLRVTNEDIAKGRELIEEMARRAGYTPLPPGSEMNGREVSDWVRRCDSDETRTEFNRLALELRRRTFADAWSSLVRIAIAAPSDDFLCTLGVWVCEGLLSGVEQVALDRVTADADDHANVRRMLSCVVLDHDDHAVKAVLSTLIPPRGHPDNIGLRPPSS